MKNVTIYTTKTCPYCVKAKMLLAKKKAEYEEIDVSDDKIRDEMVKKTNGKRSVPQIFIGGQHIGGCDDLYEMESQGRLDAVLNV